jgi:1,4-alpha-glucan branching enzyme
MPIRKESVNMITTTLLPNGDVLVTFMIDDERPVSVVGDFNGWNPRRDPFVEEIDGRRYVTVSVPADTVTCFRYLADGGEFFDDPAADRLEPNGYGQTHGVLDESLKSDAPRHTRDSSPSASRGQARLESV